MDDCTNHELLRRLVVEAVITAHELKTALPEANRVQFRQRFADLYPEASKLCRRLGLAGLDKALGHERVLRMKLGLPEESDR